MRLRDLEARLLERGWQPEPEKGGVIVAWRHPSGERLTYHRPHGTDAREMPKGMQRRLWRRLERMAS